MVQTQNSHFIIGSMLRKDNHSSKQSRLGKYFGTKNTTTLIVLLYKLDIVLISHYLFQTV